MDNSSRRRGKHVLKPTETLEDKTESGRISTWGGTRCKIKEKNIEQWKMEK